MKNAIFTIHKWAGIVAGLFLFVLGATGSALVFENSIDRALNPSTSYVRPQGGALPLSDLVSRVNLSDPRDPVNAVRIAEAPDQAYEFASRVRKTVMVDQYSGQILGTRDREKSFARKLHLLHTRFLAGENGERAAGWLSVMMLAMSISGLYLWWPRRILSVKADASWKRANFDLHNVVGFYASAVLLVVTVSAVLIAFERTTDPIVRKLDGTAAAPDLSTLQSVVSHGRPIAPEDVVAIAERTLPGARATNLNIPANPHAIYRVLMKFPEDRTPAGRSRVYLDQFTGAVLAVENTRTAPPGTRILNLKRSLHTGDVLGAPTQALYFLASLAIPAQVVTGLLLVLQRRKR